MISFRDFSFWYPDAHEPTVRSATLDIDEGEFALLVGRTGSGKSTVLRAVNGLVPHFTGGHVEGEVTTAGRNPRTSPPREFADAVGVVGQDPLAGFVTDTVEEELAYGMEQLAMAPQVMRRRVEEVLDLMGIAPLRNRALRTLSGGEQQRVALGSVLTTSPRLLVLDEPTSALDPAAAEEALAAILRLVHDLGVTVLAAEHRLERVVEYADALVVVSDATVRKGRPQEMLRHGALAPPVVQLGRLAGWHPLPLSVRDARRVAGPLRDRLSGVQALNAHSAGALPSVTRPSSARLSGLLLPPTSRATDGRADGLVVSSLTVRYGDTVALRSVDMVAEPGEVLAVMGRNGSGKSTLLWAVQGAGRRSAGSVRVAGSDTAGLTRTAAARLVALVPQQAGDLLYHDSVDAECAAADRAAAAATGATRDILERLFEGPALSGTTHPRDLSDGQRLGLALAVQLVSQPRVLLLDEPTRGLDYGAKSHLCSVLTDLAAAGCVVVVATHDVEFVAQSADQVLVLADGQVVSWAPTSEALAGSPIFAPQVAKVLAPQPWLTVDQVAHALSGDGVPHA
ncbi:MAG TPA: ATP-binding cassette domain-containing protein [Nocardioidaceae bacterium]|nr:ATP-binding cassette domain-containing protein [Nocardioidaceae bacterium]